MSMKRMFKNSSFHGDISQWNLGNVKKTGNTFDKDDEEDDLPF